MIKTTQFYWNPLKNLILCFFLMLVLPCQAVSAEIDSVLIVSIDALHPDAINPDANRARTSQTIISLMEKGVFTLDGESTNPPLTLLSHAAMVSGIGPEKGGRTSNDWHPGEPVIEGKTIFDDAKALGYTTGFFYSKQKLGYLLTDAVDHHHFDPDFAMDQALEFFKIPDTKKFGFLHVSGLDRTGPEEGWLSDGYYEELFFIDETLGPLIRSVLERKGHLIIITSDHAGHGRIHGSDHPDDARLPLIMVSDVADLSPYQGMPYQVTRLKSILTAFLKKQTD